MPAGQASGWNRGRHRAMGWRSVIAVHCILAALVGGRAAAGASATLPGLAGAHASLGAVSVIRAASSIPGDCDGNGRTSIDELTRGVGILLSVDALESCPALDLNGDDEVTVDELVRAVAAALSGPSQPFSHPERVTIHGYVATAMEPFVTRDGRYLFFNDSNAPAADTNLHYAERIDGVTFEYRGEIAGANAQALDAVASMDRDGRFYFVSTRSYADTLSTIYSGWFIAGVVADVALVPGVSKTVPGQVNFDAEISPDGNTLYLVDGVFEGGAVPVAADLAIAVRRSGRFERLADGPELLANVNTDALEYAPSISADGLELFFTRLDGGLPAIYRAARRQVDLPFGVPEPVAAIKGFAEAPSLSADGRSLYFHKRAADQFEIYRVTR